MLSNGKTAKVLFMAKCGMRVAMEFGVIRDHVSVYRYLGHADSNVWKRIYLERLGIVGPRAATTEEQGGLDDFVS